MKKFVFLLLIFAFQFVQAQAPDPDFNDKMALSEGQNHHKSAAFTESDDYANYDLIYQRLNFTVDPAVNYISGSVYSLVIFLKDNVSIIRFDLVNSMVVDSVKCNNERTTFQHLSDKISVTLLMSMPKNSIGKIEVFYHGLPPQNGMGSFTVSKHNNVPVLWTLSEPYGAKDWWPCKESLADKIDSLDVFITCPSQYKAASNGKLISEQISLGSRTAHWQHRFPIATYLVGIAVTNYETYSDFLKLPDGRKIEVLNYIYPEYLATAKTKSAEILSVLSFYNSKFITYPFASEKYGHAQFGWGGGMEHQTMSFMTTLEFELVAHEMAHQWFGDYITLASWHDIWLNEGFATYLTGLTYENLMNGVWWPVWKNNQIARITSSPGGSVYVADTTDINRIFNGRLSYSKGAYLLHMLRWEMGDTLFFRGLKNYLTDPAVANGFASQEKFVKHMETVAGNSFAGFFKDWYYGEGYPVYQLTYFPDPENPAIQKLRISQSQSNPSVAFFEMHVPVRVWKDGKYKDLRLYHTQQNQEFVISGERIDSIQFDPEKWLIAKADKVLPVQEISKPEQIQIIPDCSTNRIRVILPDFTGKETFRIFDLNGRTILNRMVQSKDSRIEINELRNGIYLVEVQTINQKRTKKIRINSN
ncbi:MAG: M1 family aminopeptidase [Bacteroidota bacterium]|nr:M1 family aminopeptidase [Bacteroidota bacterium]